MQKIIIATGNAGKIREFKAELKDYEVLSLRDINFEDDIDENGTTFVENAMIKAKTVSLFLKKQGINVPVIAEDSGLCVDTLNGAPGIYSARYAGDHAGVKNMQKLIKELGNSTNRKAHYTSVVVEYYPDDTYIVAEGYVKGYITNKPEGEQSETLPYDTVFYSEELGKVFAQATLEEKNSVSHRIKSIKNLIEMKTKKQIINMI